MRAELGVLVLGMLVITSLVPIKVELFYRRRAEDDHLELNLTWVWWRLHWELPAAWLLWHSWLPSLRVLAGEGDTRRITPNWDYWLRRWRQLKPIWALVNRLRAFLPVFGQEIYLDRFKWEIGIGYTDPVRTALVAVLCQGLQWEIWRRLQGWVRDSNTEPELQVIPQFSAPTSYLELNCIFRLPGGHIIIITSWVVAVVLFALVNSPELRRAIRQWLHHRRTLQLPEAV